MACATEVQLVYTAAFSVFARVPVTLRRTPADLFAALRLDSKRAKEVSLAERQALEGSDWVSKMPLTYGEVTFDSLASIFARLRHHGALPAALPTDSAAERDLVFVDLGHGAGRPCLAAACLFPFRTVSSNSKAGRPGVGNVGSRVHRSEFEHNNTNIPRW